MTPEIAAQKIIALTKALANEGTLTPEVLMPILREFYETAFHNGRHASDHTGYLPSDEVRRKVAEAVSTAHETERQRCVDLLTQRITILETERDWAEPLSPAVPELRELVTALQEAPDPLLPHS